MDTNTQQPAADETASKTLVFINAAQADAIFANFLKGSADKSEVKFKEVCEGPLPAELQIALAGECAAGALSPMKLATLLLEKGRVIDDHGSVQALEACLGGVQIDVAGQALNNATPYLNGSFDDFTNFNNALRVLLGNAAVQYWGAKWSREDRMQALKLLAAKQLVGRRVPLETVVELLPLVLMAPLPVVVDLYKGKDPIPAGLMEADGPDILGLLGALLRAAAGGDKGEPAAAPADGQPGEPGNDAPPPSTPYPESAGDAPADAPEAAVPPPETPCDGKCGCCSCR